MFFHSVVILVPKFQSIFLRYSDFSLYSPKYPTIQAISGNAVSKRVLNANRLLG